ncbi:MAG: hypothetical protein AAFR77_04790 [Cyanobacteria bacterium J06631_2]
MRNSSLAIFFVFAVIGFLSYATPSIGEVLEQASTYTVSDTKSGK